MSVPKKRILDLAKAQCNIFSTTFNPEGLRLGNKILRQRLKGPALAAYYPRKTVSLKDLTKRFPDWEFIDEDEEHRLDHIKGLQSRGKAAPQKQKKTPSASGGSAKA